MHIFILFIMNKYFYTRHKDKTVAANSNVNSLPLKMLLKTFAIFLFPLIYGAALGLSRNPLNPVTVEGCGKSKFPAGVGDRIVGGDVALHGQYPWAVSLHVEDRGQFTHNCGGSVLNENWILTAAHCVTDSDEPWRYEVFVGAHKQSELNGPTVQHLKIDKIYAHENYTSSTDENDIALLKTAKPIDISGSGGYVNGICLPDTEEYPSGFAITIGWGHEVQYGKVTDALKQVVLPIRSREYCNKRYEIVWGWDTVKENMICAGEKGKASCQGDSGGALFQTDSSGVSVLHGISSFGYGCGTYNFPNVYTKVSLYLDWMKNIIMAE